jgi:hypothetical protein
MLDVQLTPRRGTQPRRLQHRQSALERDADRIVSQPIEVYVH